VKSADQWGRDAEQRPVFTIFKAALIGTILVLGILAVVGLATTGSIFFQGEAAKKTVGERTNTQVFTPENKIAQIAFFHNTCNTVNAQLRIAENIQAQIKLDERAASTASSPIEQQRASDQLSQDAQNLSGAENVVQTTAADYNSRSRQSTANVFKSTGLPDQITIPNPITPGFAVNCG
jgi:cell division septation protein DedD